MSSIDRQSGHDTATGQATVCPPRQALVHLACADHLVVAYHPPTGRFFRLPRDAEDGSIRDATAGEVLPRHDLPYSLAAGLEEQLVAAAAMQLAPAPTSPGELDRLSLHVAHDCNMRCRYCYADGGSYGQPHQRMNPEVAAEIVRRVARSVGNIGLIQFFGGEPLLAIPAIAAACATASRLHRDGILREQPAFRVVTNLTIAPHEFAELVRAFDIEVVASCDGPQDLHDRLRTFLDGRPSFDVIARNVDWLQSSTSGRQPNAVEATFTRLHQDAGLSRSDLRSFLSRRFGVAEVLVEPAQGGAAAREQLIPAWSDPLREHADYARSAVRSLVEDATHLDVSGLVMAPYVLFPARAACDHFCPAALHTVTVTPSGDVYPCHMFVGVPEFHMGCVLRDTHLQRARAYRRVWQRFRDNVKSGIARCRDCWLRLICRSCPGQMLKANGSIDQPLAGDCQLKQGLVEGVLLEVADTQRQRDRWARLVANVGDAMQTMRRSRLHQDGR